MKSLFRTLRSHQHNKISTSLSSTINSISPSSSEYHTSSIKQFPVPEVSHANLGGTSVSDIFRPGGRQSVSGVVATVFGCTGFIGRAAVHHLGRVGSQVICPYRGDGMNTRHLRLNGDLGQIVPIPYDLTDEESIRRTVARSNVVINLIGSKLETANYSWEDVHEKVNYRIAKVCKEVGVERFIHVSCLGANPESNSRYYRSKGRGELIIRDFFPDATILRPAPCFGDRDRFVNVIASLGSSFYSLPVLNHGQQKIQPVFFGDVAKAMLACITYADSVGKTYELGGPDVYTYANIVKLISTAAYKDIKLTNLPEPLLRLYGKIFQGITLPLEPNPNNDSFIQTMNTLKGIVNHIRAPLIYHEDLVEQAKIDLVVTEGSRGLEELGVEATAFLKVLSKIVVGHRPSDAVPERFPDIERFKSEAKPTQSTQWTN